MPDTATPLPDTAVEMLRHALATLAYRAEKVRPESYARAAIQAGRVGREQAPPGREFDGDASKPVR